MQVAWKDDFLVMYPQDVVNPTLVKNVTFVLTENCNLACTYCYETHKSSKRMTKEIADRAIEFILTKIEGSPAVSLDFIGGEPLLEIDLMDYIMARFKIRSFELSHPWQNNYMFSLTTNGVLYDNPKVQKFLDKNKGRCSICITIDGNRELHDKCRVFPNGKGSYDIVSKNVRKWISQYPNASTKMTFSPDNLEFIPESVKHLYELGIRNIHANPVYENDWSTQESNVYYEKLKEVADFLKDHKDMNMSVFNTDLGVCVDSEDNNNYCGGTGMMLAISTDGELYPCLRYMDYSLNNQPGQPIGDIWNGIDENNKFLCELKQITRHSQSSEECLNCKVSLGCGWCSAYNYDTFGTANKRSTNICNMHKARVRAIGYYRQITNQ